MDEEKEQEKDEEKKGKEEKGQATDNTLISACEKAKQPERAWELFEVMQWQGVVPDVLIYNAVVW